MKKHDIKIKNYLKLMDDLLAFERDKAIKLLEDEDDYELVIEWED